MAFDPKKIFANLAEREKIKGHHSPEGQAIRLLSRALNGWSIGALTGRDAAILARQAMEDWLKSKLGIAAWSGHSLPALVAAAAERGVVTDIEAARLRELQQTAWRSGAEPGVQDISDTLEVCIGLLESRW